MAAVVWELPQRDLGGLLPEWDDLTEQIAAARATGAATHLDGARIWEAQTYYGRPFDEIASLFDTVYVSLYKACRAGGAPCSPAKRRPSPRRMCGAGGWAETSPRRGRSH